MKILSGDISKALILSLKEKSQKLKPKIAVIMIGNDPASLSYIKKKKEACKKIGIKYQQINLPTDISFEGLIQVIHKLNKDNSINGYILQLPIPAHLELPKIIREIDPRKDIDGFHAYNVGKMFVDKAFEDLPPATPLGIIKMFESYKIDIEGKDICIIGHSNLVGKPLSIMLLNRGATVTVCHSKTKDLKRHTINADIVISCVGKANLITEDMVKKEVIIIDVGINRITDTDGTSKLVGDTDYERLKLKAKAITPVPGGVGPMTVAALLMNTIRATERQKNHT